MNRGQDRVGGEGSEKELPGFVNENNMKESPVRLAYECTGDHGPTFADLMNMAQRELGAFFTAVTESYGSEQARLSVEEWVDELLLRETVPGLTSRDWRLITIAASARLANRVCA